VSQDIVVTLAISACRVTIVRPILASNFRTGNPISGLAAAMGDGSVTNQEDQARGG
jgi:hypothetical protein